MCTPRTTRSWRTRWVSPHPTDTAIPPQMGRGQMMGHQHPPPLGPPVPPFQTKVRDILSLDIVPYCLWALFHIVSRHCAILSLDIVPHCLWTLCHIVSGHCATLEIVSCHHLTLKFSVIILSLVCGYNVVIDFVQC